MKKYQDSTKNNYYTIWRLFNKFLIRLDRKLKQWNQRLVLFVGHLIQQKKQSSTICSYVSAIRAVLQDNDIPCNHDELLITSLTRACKFFNDRVKTRLPIQKSMLSMIINQLDKDFSKTGQTYLKIMYKALLLTMYFSLFRIGELTQAEAKHAVKAKNVFVAKNKLKMSFVLRSSKTHNRGSKLQIIKITSAKTKSAIQNQLDTESGQLPCPYEAIDKYRRIRGTYKSVNEQFFVFQDGTPVKASHLRKLLNKLIKRAGFEHPHLYLVHRIRAGCAMDLIKLGLSIDQVKRMGRWKSNAIFRYIHY